MNVCILDQILSKIINKNDKRLNEIPYFMPFMYSAFNEVQQFENDDFLFKRLW